MWENTLLVGEKGFGLKVSLNSCKNHLGLPKFLYLKVIYMSYLFKRKGDFECRVLVAEFRALTELWKAAASKVQISVYPDANET